MIKKLRYKLCKLLFKDVLETFLDVDGMWYHDGVNDGQTACLERYGLEESEL